MIARLLAALLLIFSCTYSYAQKQVSGKVTLPDGTAVSGATVSLKGGKVSVATKNDGTFTLSVPESAKALLITYVGYQNQEVEIAGKGALSITLQAQDGELNDVVVIGYGTQRKQDLTGAVAKVNVTDLMKAPVRSFEEAMAGRVAGVQVNSSDGQPGAPISIVIRGNNSITQDNSPLYVIDGFPLESPNANSINPSDIESVEVLKDASATAIYGARAANGVVLITTKRGKAGKTEVNFTGFYGMQEIVNKLQVLSPYEFVRYQYELDSVNTKSQYLTGGKSIESYRNVKGIDWQDEVFQKAPMYNAAVSMRGGNNFTKFFLSLSAMEQEGIVKFSGYNRYQGRFRFDHAFSSKFKVGMNLNYSAMKSYGTIPSTLSNSSSQSSNLMFSVWGYRPNLGDTTVDLLNENDPYFENDLNDSRFNPLETVKYEMRDRYSNVLFGNLTLDYEIVKDLKFKFVAGYTNEVERNEEFNNSRTRAGSPYTSTGRANGVNGSFVYRTTNTYVVENTLSHIKKFTKNQTLESLAGFTVQGVDRYIYGAAASRLPNERLGLAGLDEGIPSRVSSSRTDNTLVSALARVMYNHSNRYLLTLSFRADGSSKFSTENKWSYFPSGSIGWRFGQEKWLMNSKVISDAKLRIGYGMVGNNRVNDFAYLSTFNSPITLAYPFNGSINSSTLPFSLGNPNLRWETTAQSNIGLDISFLEKRLALTVDAYYKLTDDLLLNADLPPSSGFSSAFKNVGKVENKGLEFTLDARIIENRKFKWSANFNIAFNRNKVLSLNEGQENLLSTINWDNQWRSQPAYIARVGQPVGLFYGLVWDGLYQLSDFDQNPNGSYVLKPNVPSNTTTASSRIQPGHIKYKDLNGDFIINDFDRTIIGDANPDFFGGFTNNFSYKGFDLNIFFQYSYGNEILNANRLVFEGNSGRTLQNQYASVLKRWTIDNQNNEMYVARGDGDKVYSSRVIEDGSYIRLKTMQLGYNFQGGFLKRMKISAFRLYVSAQNLLTWTKYTGFDPEVSAYNSALTPGFDYSVYPRARTIAGGLNLTF